MTLCIAWFGEARLPAAPALDTSSPLNFFTGTANLLLQNAGYNFTVTNIPVYPTNYYTPALHGLLQLAANIYDASTNRAFSDGSSPNGPFYPSVFRPTFNRVGSNVFIAGYVEEGDGTMSYNAIPLSLPEDFASVSATTTNIFGIPWVIGARKGFPNFNEFSMASVAQTTRKVQIVFNSLTNLQYIIGISNVLGVEAWNSYATNYTRSVSLVGVAQMGVTLTNEFGELLAQTNLAGASIISWGKLSPFEIPANTWGGFARPTIPGANSNSFQIPLFTNVVFVPDFVYHPTSFPRLSPSTNFDTTGSLLTPQFVLNCSNRLQFAMVDNLTGRVVDYVSLGGMNFSRDLSSELIGTDGGGPGGVWLTNLQNGQLAGVLRQIEISAGIGAPNFTSPSDWISTQLQPTSEASAVQAFAVFLNGGSPANVMEAPYTPTRER